MKEGDHVIEVLQKAKKAAKNSNIFELKNLSDQTVHTASIEQDQDNVLVAVIVYTLSKLIEKRDLYSDKDYEKYLNYSIGMLDNFIDSLKKNDPSAFQDYMNEMTKRTSTLPDYLRKSIDDVFKKARINKASKIYEHGLSMGKTAELLGISLWDLAEYTGQGGMADAPLSITKDIKSRIARAMEIFK
jgi:hypothetical protein